MGVKRTTRESLERIGKCHGKIEKKMIKNFYLITARKHMVKIERMAEKKIGKRES